VRIQPRVAEVTGEVRKMVGDGTDSNPMTRAAAQQLHLVRAKWTDNILDEMVGALQKNVKRPRYRYPVTWPLTCITASG
jgi:hypothetical protein